MSARENPAASDEIDDLAWSDSARTGVAVHASAIVMAWTVYTSDTELRQVVLAGCCVHASITLTARRSRRVLAAPLQVVVALIVLLGFGSCSKGFQKRAWNFVVFLVYIIECFGWREATADLIELAFARFQKQLFASIIIFCVWGMPALYSATERLEAEQHQAVGYSFEAEAFRQQIAGTILYGGTALLLTASAAIWIRLYRVAPELFRLLCAVLLTGCLAGATLAFLSPFFNELQILTGAATASFVAMAYCLLHDKCAAHSICALGIFLFISYLMLTRPHFAILVFFAQLLNKFAFVVQLHALGNRRPRNSTTRILSTATSSAGTADFSLLFQSLILGRGSDEQQQRTAISSSPIALLCPTQVV